MVLLEGHLCRFIRDRSYLCRTQAGAALNPHLRGPSFFTCKEDSGRLFCGLVGVVQPLSRVRLLVIPWTAACQASVSFTICQNLLKLMFIESVMSSNHLIFCPPLLLHLQSVPAPGSFQMSQFFASGGQSIGASASASVLPMNSQD